MKIVKIKNIKEIECDSKRYDIQTKETNNFFANGILVHNSLIQVYWDWNNEKWFAATSGTGEGESEVNNKFGTTFGELFWDTLEEKYNFNDCLLDKDHVYAFELTTPYNIVVKSHGESSTTLLAVRNRVTLKEVGYKELGRISDSLGIPLVKSYDLNTGNVGSLIRTFDDMPFFEEGYVVVDGDFNRIKIKNPAYVNAHHLKGKMGNHHIIGIIKTNEIDEFIATFKDREEEIRHLDAGYELLTNKLESVWVVLENLKPKNTTPKEKKRYVMEVFRVCEENDTKMFTGLYFGLNDGKVDSVKDYLREYDDKKLYEILIK